MVLFAKVPNGRKFQAASERVKKSRVEYASFSIVEIGAKASTVYLEKNA